MRGRGRDQLLWLASAAGPARDRLPARGVMKGFPVKFFSVFLAGPAPCGSQAKKVLFGAEGRMCSAGNPASFLFGIILRLFGAVSEIRMQVPASCALLAQTAVQSARQSSWVASCFSNCSAGVFGRGSQSSCCRAPGVCLPGPGPAPVGPGRPSSGVSSWPSARAQVGNRNGDGGGPWKTARLARAGMPASPSKVGARPGLERPIPTSLAQDLGRPASRASSTEVPCPAHPTRQACPRGQWRPRAPLPRCASSSSVAAPSAPWASPCGAVSTACAVTSLASGFCQSPPVCFGAGHGLPSSGGDDAGFSWGPANQPRATTIWSSAVTKLPRAHSPRAFAPTVLGSAGVPLFRSVLRFFFSLLSRLPAGARAKPHALRPAGGVLRFRNLQLCLGGSCPRLWFRGLPVLFWVCGLSPLFFLLPWRFGPLFGWIALSRRLRPHSFFAQGPRLLLEHLAIGPSCSVALPLRWQRRARLWLQKTPQARLASQSVLQGVARLFRRTRVLAPSPLVVRGSRGPPGAKNKPAQLGTVDEERGRLPGQIGAFRAIRRFFCIIAPQIRAEIRECVCFFAATWKITRYSSCMACMAHPRSRFILMISTFTLAIGGAVATGARSAPAGKTLSHAGKVGS